MGVALGVLKEVVEVPHHLEEIAVLVDLVRHGRAAEGVAVAVGVYTHGVRRVARLGELAPVRVVPPNVPEVLVLGVAGELVGPVEVLG